MKAILIRENYKSHIITPPIGIGYLASYLITNGIEVKIIDNLKEQLGKDRLIEAIAAQKPDMVGMTCLTAFYNETVELCKNLKARGMRCVIGGIHPTFLPKKTLEESGADYVICGEGEKSLLELARNNFQNKNIKGVYSLMDFPKCGESPDKSDIIENLDDIPFPAWDQIDPRRYPKAPHGGVVKDFPIGIIVTSRGCPFECTFCASPGFCGRRIRFRSPENVVSEIKYLVKNFGIKEVHFEDDNLTLHREHVMRICELILESDVKVSWACPNGIRADRVDEEMMQLMKKSGCYYVAFGVESANESILNKVRKRESLSVIRKGIEIAAKVGIQAQGFFIFGLPGETVESIQETISFALKVPLKKAQFLILDVLPGSELWSSLIGEFQPNWGKNSFKEPEWVPKGLKKEDLLKAQKEAFSRFYLRPRIILSMLKYIRLSQFPYIFQRLKDYRLFGS